MTHEDGHRVWAMVYWLGRMGPGTSNDWNASYPARQYTGGSEMTDQEYEVHDHDWYWSGEDFKCDYEFEDDSYCAAFIDLDDAVKLLPKSRYDSMAYVQNVGERRYAVATNVDGRDI